MTYFINREMIGNTATDRDVERMVALLQERGYNAVAESGPMSFDDDYDAIPDSVWMDCLFQIG